MRYNRKGQTILALETSCDESAAAVLRFDAGKLELLSSQIASQIEVHAQWGGVVPEIASRKHLEILPFLIEDALKESEQKMEDIDAVAATVAPGLSGSLLVGSITARTIASLYKVPFLGVHHLEGHLASVELGETCPATPYLVLLVSGGHTELILVKEKGCFKRLGRSHDDAAGEAFDKVGRLLGLSYPGGPAIEKISNAGDPHKFSLPKGKVSNPEGGFYPYDFSFSGLKTAMMRQVETLKATGEKLPIVDLAASFEQIVAEVLVERSLRCVLDQGLNDLVMVGGVAANRRLRKMMAESASEHSVSVHFAPKAFCTDNAAMIGAAALIRLQSEISSSSFELGVSARWPLDEADDLYRSPPPF